MQDSLFDFPQYKIDKKIRLITLFSGIGSQEEVKYQIRKLTPRETWRLMGFSDTDFDKAAGVVSNSQLYRQSGNSIVKQVLMAIFLQLNIQGLRNWNDRTKEEREAFFTNESQF